MSFIRRDLALFQQAGCAWWFVYPFCGRSAQPVLRCPVADRKRDTGMAAPSLVGSDPLRSIFKPLFIMMLNAKIK